MVVCKQDVQTRHIGDLDRRRAQIQAEDPRARHVRGQRLTLIGYSQASSTVRHTLLAVCHGDHVPLRVPEMS